MHIVNIEVKLVCNYVKNQCNISLIENVYIYYSVALPPSAINGYCGLQGSIYYLNITWLPAVRAMT